MKNKLNVIKGFFLFIIILSLSCGSKENYFKINSNLWGINYSDEKSGDSGKEITISFHDAPESYDPFLAQSEIELLLKNAIFATLFKINPASGVPEKNLLENYEINNDGKEYILTLRENLFFAGGKPLEAEDAAASLSLVNTLLKNRRSSKAFHLNNTLFEAEAIDKKNLKIKIDAPNSFIFYTLSSFPIISKEAVRSIRENSFDWNDINRTNAAASGPFIIRSINEDSIELEKNKNYFNNSLNNINIPRTEKLYIKIFPNKNKEIVDFANNRSDILSVESEDIKNLYAHFKNSNEIRIVSAGKNGKTVFLLFNASKPYFKNLDARAFLGKKILNSVKSIFNNKFNYSSAPPEYLPAMKGKKPELKNIQLKIILPAGNKNLLSAAKKSEAILKSCGAKTKVEPLPLADFSEKLLSNNDYDIALFNYQRSGGVLYNYELLNSKEMNFNIAEGSSLSDKLNAILNEKDFKKIDEMQKELSKNIYERSILIPLIEENKFYLIKKNIYNFKINTASENSFNLKTLELIFKK